MQQKIEVLFEPLGVGVNDLVKNGGFAMKRDIENAIYGGWVIVNTSTSYLVHNGKPYLAITLLLERPDTQEH